MSNNFLFGQGPTLGGLSPLSNQGTSPRPSYYVLNYNVNGGYACTNPYDADLRSMSGTPQNQGPQSAQFGWLRGCLTDSQSQVATNATHPQGTVTIGEFGHDYVLPSERGYTGSTIDRFNTYYGYYANRAFVNSDHLDRGRVLTFSSGVLMSSPLWLATTRTISVGYRADVYSKTFTSAGLNMAGSQITNMFGTGSYNAVRKELVITASNSTVAGQFDVYIWKNIDLNANPDVSLIPDRPTVILTWNLASTTGSRWGTTSNQEIITNPKIVLCDDGTIVHASAASQGTTTPGHQWFRLTRNSDDTALTAVVQTTNNTTNTYGAETGAQYGQRAIQSKNGRLVALYAATYYYQGGISTVVVDKRTSQFNSFLDTGANGVQFVKYREDSLILTRWAQFTWQAFGATNLWSPVAGGAPSRVAGPTLSTGVYPSSSENGTYFTNYAAIAPVWELNLQTPLPY
jgi:hypothetical protein